MTIRYGVTDQILEALEEGRTQKNWSHARLAREAGISPQLYNEIRHRRVVNSEHVPALLRAVGQPEGLAQPELDIHRTIIEHLEKVERELGPEHAGRLVEMYKQIGEGQIALLKKDGKSIK